MAYNIYEVKMQDLLKLKVNIQKLQREQNEHRELWRNHSEKVRQLGQEISEKREELMDQIKV